MGAIILWEFFQLMVNGLYLYSAFIHSLTHQWVAAAMQDAASPIGSNLGQTTDEDGAGFEPSTNWSLDNPLLLRNGTMTVMAAFCCRADVSFN